MKIVLDTNILVSALLSPFGKPARVLDLVLLDDLRLVYDDRILSEYSEVLNRPRFGFDKQNITGLLNYFLFYGVVVTAPPLAITLPDSDDLPFLEVAFASQSTLVTGNKRHFPEALQNGVRVLTPAAFLEWWHW